MATDLLLLLLLLLKRQQERAHLFLKAKMAADSSIVTSSSSEAKLCNGPGPSVSSCGGRGWMRLHPPSDVTSVSDPAGYTIHYESESIRRVSEAKQQELVTIGLTRLGPRQNLVEGYFALAFNFFEGGSPDEVAVWLYESRKPAGLPTVSSFFREGEG